MLIIKTKTSQKAGMNLVSWYVMLSVLHQKSLDSSPKLSTSESLQTKKFPLEI